jgi:Ca-activated chloride channel family protein
MRHWFAYPPVLGSLALLLALGLLGAWARRRRRRALGALGNVALLETALTPRRGLQTLAALCLLAGLVAAGVGAAGPQWGKDWSQSAAPGRDLVVALDCSRSMFAETPSRLERARAALLDLADGLRRRGGHRVGLVVFAGKARLVCPLTHDYDHFREAVSGLDPQALDAELGPASGEKSGTRIGAGLRAAVLAQDIRFAGARDVVLLSDGDDPAGDGEWQSGAAEAQAQGIPIYAVGIGDSGNPSTVRFGGALLRFDGKEVRTRLEEAPLREIARRTGGEYFPAHTRPVRLGELYLDVIARQPVREEGDDALPVYQSHADLFLGPAFGLLAASMLLGGWPGFLARRVS